MVVRRFDYWLEENSESGSKIAVPGKVLNESGSESEGGWWTNELRGGRPGSKENGRDRNRQRRGGQNRRESRSLGTVESGVGGGADRTGVVRGRRVLGVRVGRLDHPHCRQQGNAEQSKDSDRCAPIYGSTQHWFFTIVRVE